MDRARLENLLRAVQSGETGVADAMESLRGFPYDDSLGYARLDTHRAVRTGHPEVVFCQGKTVGQCVAIAERLAEMAPVVLLTRASAEVGAAVTARLARATYHEAARCVVVGTPPDPPANAPYVAVASAGTADLPVAEEAIVTLQTLGSPVERLYDVGVAGLHRLLDRRAVLDGAACIVVVAGMEGALASVVGGLVACPVVACPTSVGYGAAFGGVAALLTMLNSCATGVSVVNIDNGFGAGYFAHLVASSAAATAHRSSAES
jgi:hypothetical protein